jgi:hypothetical protein
MVEFLLALGALVLAGRWVASAGAALGMPPPVAAAIAAVL